MALTETTGIDKIEVMADGYILVREATNIFRDGEEISSTFHRTSYAPGADTASMPERVRVIAEAVWTQEVIDAYNTRVAQLSGA